eukprot:TRINITY_DN939_c0_g1_i1.p2 TRINITY_DN939_c0_g1~~TRINITY_DN939_c0_g1_i1.p2  ORF type:complete len:338 (+),score=183.90 TRINITY_DN939_c0_g1_i1:71-1084(+)
MSCTTSFKIYFNEEIHRVGIPSAEPSLVQFLDSVKSIFSAEVKDINFLKIQYIDEDGDRITVSSEDEWKEALSTMKAVSPKKIYASIDNSRQRHQQPNERKACCPRRNIAQPNKIENAVNALAEGVEIDFESFGNDLVKLPHVLQMRSLSLMNNKDYDKAHNLLKAAVRLNPHSSVDLYNLACVYALTGKNPEACAYLQKSVESGYKDIKHLQSDPDLVSIRKMAEYEEIIQGLKANCPIRFMNQRAEEKKPEPEIKVPEVAACPAPAEQAKVEEQPKEEIPAPEAPKAPKANESEQKYKEQLEHLAELGFTDSKRNIKLLEKKKGNLDVVVNILLN